MGLAGGTGRVGRDLAPPERLRALLEATQTISRDLSLPDVLHRVVECACELADARYGALGVVGADHRLEQFVHVGVEDDTAAAIGPLPTGKGILGLLITDPRPLRLVDLGGHAESTGFPPGHPAMRSFLGAPIRIRGRVFGNLYLTEKRGAAAFTSEDEELVTALAAAAAVAVDNARLFDDAMRRQQWLQASAEITRALLAGLDGRDALTLVSAQARAVARADVVSILLPVPGDSRFLVEVADGLGADELVGRLVPADRALSGEAVRTRRPAVVDDIGKGEWPDLAGAGGEIGPVMAMPLTPGANVLGTLVVGRLRESAGFSASEVEMAAGFAGQAALALEVSRGRAHRDRVLLLDDRERIARDLHDHAIQRLFATGLGLYGMVHCVVDDDSAERLLHHVDELDATIRDIRTTIFALRCNRADAASLRSAVLDVVERVTPSLGAEPRVRLEGPIDGVVPAGVCEHVLAVLSEALSNVARHARASEVEVRLCVEAGRVLLVRIRDDGVGAIAPRARQGLVNMEERALQLGGRFELRGRPGQGTVVEWRVPLHG